MLTFFGEQPLLLQALPELDHAILVGLNRVGQVLVLTAAAMAAYQDDLLAWFRRILNRVSSFIRNLAATVGWRWTVGLEFPPEIPVSHKSFHEDVDIRKQLALSIILLLIAFWLFGRGPFGWISFPFEFVWRGITLWVTVKWATGPILQAIFESIGRLLAFFPLLYVSILGCAIIARPFAFFFSQAADKLGPGHYRLAMSVVLLFGSLLVLVAT